jgi:Tfp pilus assembly protein PilN
MNGLFENIYFVLSLPFWMVVGKVVLVIILLLFSFLCLYSLINARKWHQELINMEHQALLARDDAMFEFMSARAAIEAAKERVYARHNKQSQSEFTEQVVKNVGSLLWMLLRKEQSLVQWGMVGAKLARSAFHFFSKS